MPKKQCELTPYRKAWLYFKSTKDFVASSNPETLGIDAKNRPYLENRIELAFAAGWNSKASSILEALDAHLKKEEI
jgi:hypothetical protein